MYTTRIKCGITAWSPLLECPLQASVNGLIAGFLLEFRTPVLCEGDLYDLGSPLQPHNLETSEHEILLISTERFVITLADKGKASEHWIWTKKK